MKVCNASHNNSKDIGNSETDNTGFVYETMFPVNKLISLLKSSNQRNFCYPLIVDLMAKQFATNATTQIDMMIQ